ncbi:MAG: hypothetical protein M1838_000518 [Thelocarpon superellum]|nr:MAG: hypothetical protein M1838_000518 [Thelocarpon superellum]
MDHPDEPQQAPPSVPHHPTSYHSRQQQRGSADAARDPSVSPISPEDSPTSTSFAGRAAPAPDPPAYTTAGSGQRSRSGRTESRRQRDSQLQDRPIPDSPLLSDPPPVAHEPPPPLPPVSYRESQANVTTPRRRAAAATASTPSRTNGGGSTSRREREQLPNVKNARAPPAIQTPVVAVKAASESPPETAIPQQARLVTLSKNQGTPITASGPGSTARRAAGPSPLTSPQRREWAPDRSPLQKLELTLQDITKEEKRAQMEEAEMLAREAKAGRGSRKSTRRTADTAAPSTSRSVAEPAAAAATAAALADAGLIRGLSQRQKDRIQRTTTLDTQPPAAPRQLSPDASGHGFIYQDQHDPSLDDLPTPGGLAEASDAFDRAASDATLGAHSPSTAVPVTRQPTHTDQVVRSSAAGAGGPRVQQDEPMSELDSETDDSREVPLGLGSRIMHALGPRFGGGRAAREEVTAGPPPGARERPMPRPATVQGTSERVLPPPPPPLDEWRTATTAQVNVADLPRLERRGTARTDDSAWWESGGANTTRQYTLPSDANPDDHEVDENAPTTFEPPLYLKCGPLLRYRGIRVEHAQAHATSDGLEPPAASEREVWRGSVMIVTEDSDSLYDVPPTLRLFLQPVDLLPPPPAHVDGEGGQLAPEYIDPIAGLPLLSRTGQTIYVKPVDHLPESKDLSRIEDDNGLYEDVRSPAQDDGPAGSESGAGGEATYPNNRIRKPDGEMVGDFSEVQAVRLLAERGVTFWRFNLEVVLSDRQCRIGYRINRGPAMGFWVPARGETMNIMFHTCNGFSLTVDPDQFSGPDPMWRDVLNAHQTRPFHVMIGGGDQIYNDAVVKQTSFFQDWLNIKNPSQKYSTPFSPAMRQELDTFYLERYSMWFSQGLFGLAIAQIPMVNIWDDHDIIDGFGSYPDHFMASPVFSGLGAVAFKYYMLFQHQSLPAETETEEPSWLLGDSLGPYIKERSRSVFVSLGRSVAFLGLDCRTERMRDEVLSQETYDRVFERCKHEITKGETKHLIVLLGIPIAYPRLVWLENILTSRLADPLKTLGKSGMLGGLLNRFDGGIEILDDLDDHWTARSHKAERNWFLHELQELAAGKSVRITILGGDVHLAAIGQFYSNPKLGIPKDKDHRYMPNVISSAIVNSPPPNAMGDILNRRNRVHHLDPETDEDMIPLFTHDVDGKSRANQRLLLRRNWCSIREYHPGGTPPLTPEPPEPESPPPEPLSTPKRLSRTLSMNRNDVSPGNLLRRLSNRGQPSSRAPVLNGSPRRTRPPPGADSTEYFPAQSVGSSTSAGTPQRPSLFHHATTELIEGKKKTVAATQRHINLEEGLDIVLNAEVNQRDPAGITMPYRLLVPALWYEEHDESGPPPLRRRLTGWARRPRPLRSEFEGDEDEEEENEYDPRGEANQADAARYAAALAETQDTPTTPARQETAVPAVTDRDVELDSDEDEEEVRPSPNQRRARFIEEGRDTVRVSHERSPARVPRETAVRRLWRNLGARFQDRQDDDDDSYDDEDENSVDWEGEGEGEGEGGHDSPRNNGPPQAQAPAHEASPTTTNTPPSAPIPSTPRRNSRLTQSSPQTQTPTRLSGGGPYLPSPARNSNGDGGHFTRSPSGRGTGNGNASEGKFPRAPGTGGGQQPQPQQYPRSPGTGPGRQQSYPRSPGAGDRSSGGGRQWLNRLSSVGDEIRDEIRDARYRLPF